VRGLGSDRLVAERSASRDYAEFVCPLSIDGSGRCQLFEATLGTVPVRGGIASTLRVTCRYLVLNNDDGDRCLLGDAKSRRDHLA
jgi:hypothetical protein